MLVVLLVVVVSSLQGRSRVATLPLLRPPVCMGEVRKSARGSLVEQYVGSLIGFACFRLLLHSIT